ncbi:MAG: fumarylacetoacetase [Thermoleophilaceae bacterium]|nr:fumarylacetoacetase [Thermoleophilaceae bacterium]
MTVDLPYGVARPPSGEARCVVRLGDRAVDLSALDLPVPPGTFEADALNPFLALGEQAWADVHGRLEELADPELPGWSLDDVDLLLPVAVGDYVDFYSSRFHAENVSRLFRPDDEPLLPNWRRLPVGYHGRAGTVVASGTPVRRPTGRLGPDTVGPEPMLDYELELAFVTGAGAIFGFALMNDWSARAIQGFEYQPLGPFLGKSFATSISQWVVPIHALEPCRVAGPPQDPAPLPYLTTSEPWNFDIALEVDLNGEVISTTTAAGIYWSAAQQLAHASSNGAVIRPGDLHATGTISGTAPDHCGSLIEIGRPFLDDGDEVVLRASAGDLSLSVAGSIRPA